MKVNFVLSAIAAAMLASAASAQTANDMVIQAGTANRLSVASNMHVVLRPAMPGQEDFSINKEAANGLQIKLKGQSIELSTATDKAVTVYLIVNDLEALTMGENALVQTAGILSAPLINVFADANSKAILNTTGKVAAHAPLDGDVKVTVSPLDARAAF